MFSQASAGSDPGLKRPEDLNVSVTASVISMPKRHTKLYIIPKGRCTMKISELSTPKSCLILSVFAVDFLARAFRSLEIYAP